MFISSERVPKMNKKAHIPNNEFTHHATADQPSMDAVHRDRLLDQKIARARSYLIKAALHKRWDLVEEALRTLQNKAIP